MPQEDLEQFRRSLSATRREADETITAAEARAHEIHDRAAEAERSLAADRIASLVEIRSGLSHDQRRIDATFAELVDTLAAASAELARAAREADFSVPPRPVGIGHTVEFKLSETRTREVTVRIADRGAE